MRVIKVVQWGIGMAAASSALALLSGSALAATSTAAVPVQSAPVVNQATPSVNSNDGTGLKPINDSQQSVTSSQQSSSTSTSNSVTGAVTGSGPDKNAPTGGAGGNSGSIATTGVQGSDANSTSNPTSTGSGNSDVAPIVSGVGGDVGSTGSALVNGNIVPEVVVAPITQPTAASDTKVAAAAPAAILHATVLRLQPTIMNRTEADSGDLAAAVPSVPVSEKAPVPAKSNGAMGELSAMLAGSVVPQLFSLHGTPVAHTILAIGVVAVLFLLGSTFFYTYGLWLRRGGFATAARSDVPSAGFSSILFATPLLLGYLSASRADDSPHLVVADMKISDAIPNTRYQISAPKLADDLPETNAPEGVAVYICNKVCSNFVYGIRNFLEFPTFSERRIYS